MTKPPPLHRAPEPEPTGSVAVPHISLRIEPSDPKDFTFARELLTDLTVRIEKERATVHDRIERERSYWESRPGGYDHMRGLAREEWGNFEMQVLPMRRQREHIIRELSFWESCQRVLDQPQIVLRPPRPGKEGSK